ncbi:MAG: hypothetical protein ACRBK7_05415 [Acidimicrobiales bacterium]
MTNPSNDNAASGGAADSSDVECTAIVIAGDPRPNVLFTPPCTCSNCAPDRSYDHTAGRRDDRWLRMSGSRQRLRVQNVELGAAGAEMLG